MKVGDLVRHAEDEVLGLILEGPIAYDVSRHAKPDVYSPRFKVHWFDMENPNEEGIGDMVVVSSAYEKDKNNLNTSE